MTLGASFQCSNYDVACIIKCTNKAHQGKNMSFLKKCIGFLKYFSLRNELVSLQRRYMLSWCIFFSSMYILHLCNAIAEMVLPMNNIVTADWCMDGEKMLLVNSRVRTYFLNKWIMYLTWVSSATYYIVLHDLICLWQTGIAEIAWCHCAWGKCHFCFKKGIKWLCHRDELYWSHIQLHEEINESFEIKQS